MRTTIALLLFIILGGCATWQHPTKNGNDFQRDRYACEKDNAATADTQRANSMWKLCMQIKGWTDQ